MAIPITKIFNIKFLSLFANAQAPGEKDHFAQTDWDTSKNARLSARDFFILLRP
jgi:hypothetical protein